MIDITLQPNRDFSLLRRHPWVFSGAIAHVDGSPESGETVRVRAADGTVLGFGAFSPTSQIRIRMWSFDPDAVIDDAFFADRIGRAVGARARFFADAQTDAFRLVNAEADGLPGLIVDRYGEWLVCQFSFSGAERWKAAIIRALQTFSPCRGIYERSDLDVRIREGLPSATGTLAGETPPDRITIEEYGCKYLVDIKTGHKTGFYLDQRDNRQKVKAFANGMDVLNAFSYTGGFGIAALTAGAASVTHVELSETALAMARENTLLNTCTVDEKAFIQGDVFTVLRKFRDQGRSFDLIILDPPKFADSKGSLMKAARGYKDINLLGIKLLRPGGILATFSCSGLMTPDLFHKVVTDAAVDAKRDIQILSRLQQSEDHPEGLCFPEGLYLKGLLLRG
ncbi:MAG: class I SAM-dependent methyltransferase [Kiritimatiellae bacterium]|nr:class I SAM-dependent methyltransferase [Kiritimatiellia bacterium]